LYTVSSSKTQNFVYDIGMNKYREEIKTDDYEGKHGDRNKHTILYHPTSYAGHVSQTNILLF
jgi:hypothetical protein